MSAIALSFPEFRKAAATTSKPHPLKENSKILGDPHAQLSPLRKEPDDGSARSAQCGDRRRLSRQRSTKGSLGGRPLFHPEVEYMINGSPAQDRDPTLPPLSPECKSA